MAWHIFFVSVGLAGVGVVSLAVFRLVSTRAHLPWLREKICSQPHVVGVTAPTLTPSSQAPLQELITTEAAYLRDLTTLCAAQEELKEVPIGNVAALRLLHTELASTLGAEPSSPLTSVAQAFETAGPYLTALYSEYVLGQYERLRAIEEVRRHDVVTFRKTLK